MECISAVNSAVYSEYGYNPNADSYVYLFHIVEGIASIGVQIDLTRPSKPSRPSEQDHGSSWM